jgi:hypothetical protein
MRGLSSLSIIVDLSYKRSIYHVYVKPLSPFERLLSGGERHYYSPPNPLPYQLRRDLTLLVEPVHVALLKQTLNFNQVGLLIVSVNVDLDPSAP